MAYDVTLVQMDGSLGGFVSTVPGFGFPTTPFNYLLFSYWTCIPRNSGNAGTVGPAAFWFSGGPTNGYNYNVGFDNTAAGNVQFFSGNFGNIDMGSVRTHILLSVNCTTQTVQVYANDQPLSIISGAGWIMPNQFHLTGSGFDQFKFDIGASGGYPACADVWCANTPAFVDLTVTANRRKFINADLTPVYAGANGSAPFGYQPPVWLTVPTGGVANDFLHNYGSGGAMMLQGVGPGSISLQAPGVCVLPTPPPPPPVKLALDNVAATTPVETQGRLIFLSWSNDRGHSWGNPVGQPIGDRGEYLTSVQWQRLSYARDRVFKLEWSVPVATALQGAWIEIDTSAKS